MKIKRNFFMGIAKKLCCGVLAATMVITGLPQEICWENEKTVYAESTERKYTVGNSTYTYTVYYNTITITGYKGTDSRVEIPNEIEGKPVIDIAIEAFNNDCSNIVEIVIPKNVSDIDTGEALRITFAFGGCTNLKAFYVDESNKKYKSVDGVLYSLYEDKVTMLCYPQKKENIEFILPKDVTFVMYGAFRSKTPSLKEVKVEEGNTYYKSVDGVLFYIGYSRNNLVYYPPCKKDDIYIVPEDVYGIDWEAIEECKNIKKLIISEGVEYIDGGGICSCTNLTEVIIPKSLRGINGVAFEGCTSLKAINVDKESIEYKSLDGVLFSSDGKGLLRYPTDKNDEIYEIPQGVEYIYLYAFSDCKKLMKLIIPNSVTEMRYGEGIVNCDNLTIYGEKNSYAQTYAENNNIPFVAIEELTSGDNITVTYNTDDESQNLKLYTKKLTNTDEEYKNIDFTGKLIDETLSPSNVKFTGYDISLLDESGKTVQPNNTVKVKIPCPSEYEGTKCKVYRSEKNGTFTDMSAVYKNEYLVFETNHFSTYIITETELVANPDMILGDVNGDGEVDIKDSALIKRHLAGWEVDINMAAGDVNDDGDVNIKDSALIKRLLAGWEIEQENPSPTDNKTVTIHFENGKNWKTVGAYIYEGVGFTTNVTPMDKAFVISKYDDGTPKVIWPGAKMEKEFGNWYKITATFEDAANNGIAIIFNNGVGDTKPNDAGFTQADADATKASGIPTTGKEQTANVTLGKKAIAKMGGVPSDLYITYNGKVTGNPTNIEPDSYKAAKN